MEASIMDEQFFNFTKVLDTINPKDLFKEAPSQWFVAF
jgi:hypothetical protein